MIEVSFAREDHQNMFQQIVKGHIERNESGLSVATKLCYRSDIKRSAN